MKKFVIIAIVLSLLVVSIPMADPGINNSYEAQGLRTTTTIMAAGNFNTESSMVWTITDKISITDIPGPGWVEPKTEDELGATIYQTVYAEDTQNSEVGYFSYDKDLDVQTGNKVSGQYNVKAIKQITYLGIDASSVVTNDYLMLDGAGWVGAASERLNCPFPSLQLYPTYCNKVETGSTMNLKVANLNTQLGDRFVMKLSDSAVEIFNNVGVSSYTTEIPSKGSASAYIKGNIKEARSSTGLYETITFSDSTTISGNISNFTKAINYNSEI